MSQYTFQHLVDFMDRERWTLESPPNGNTKLYADYKLYGDDAAELILAYSKHFNVDVSKFMFDQYFKGEGYDFFDEVISLFTGKSKPIPKDLSLEDLEKGILAGRLNEDVLAS